MINIVKSHKLNVAAFVAVIFLLGFFSFFASTTAFGGMTSRYPTNKSGELYTFTFFTATTTSATSTNNTTGDGQFTIAGARRVVFYLTHGGTATTSTATSTFKIQTSKGDGVWDDYYKLMTATSTVTQQIVSIVGATSTVVAEMYNLPTASFYSVRCVVVEGVNGQNGQSGDGEHTCVAQAEF